MECPVLSWICCYQLSASVRVEVRSGLGSRARKNGGGSSLRVRYAMSGTDIGDTALHYVIFSTERLGHVAIYAMSSTGLGIRHYQEVKSLRYRVKEAEEVTFRPTEVLCDVRVRQYTTWGTDVGYAAI
eukprot:1303764-Rhodomonas_salina.2